MTPAEQADYHRRIGWWWPYGGTKETAEGTGMHSPKVNNLDDNAPPKEDGGSRPTTTGGSMLTRAIKAAHESQQHESQQKVITKAKLIAIANMLDDAERLGRANSDVEGACFINMSDELARELAADLKAIAERGQL